MNVQSIDLGHKLRQGVHFCLDLAPVIICRPIARQRLNRRELYSLGCICNRFSFRPLCRVDAPAQFGKLCFRETHMKRTNRVHVRCMLAAPLCSTGLGPGAAVFCFLIALVLTFLVTIASRFHSGDSLNSSKILKVAPLLLLRICPRAWTKFRYLEVVAS